MAMFTPKNQLRNMLQNQAAQSQINNKSGLEQMLGLFILSQQSDSQKDLYIENNWLADDDLRV